MKVIQTQGLLGRLDSGELIRAHGEQGALKQVSQQFETMFLQTVLKQMRTASDAIADEDNLLSSSNDGLYRDWYDSELALYLSQIQSTGLADVMSRQLGAKLQFSAEPVVSSEKTTMAMQPALLVPPVHKETE
ncbi:rod-binding protein [Shewanella algae]|uniref:rod-binding protein n=1 Tax=Shewanella algae TaxID=38313 RepID=UPI000B8A6F26|nr:rod-binding protein [Shewanella algae]OXS02715.1 peptidoglycan hydrolase [Shewanella algae]